MTRTIWPPAAFDATGGTLLVPTGLIDLSGPPAFVAAAATALGHLAAPAGLHGTPARLVTAEDLAAEAYRLSIRQDEIVIEAADADGARQGAITLRQLLPADAWRRAGHSSWQLPCGQLADAPALTWRGTMLDVARHFLPVPDILRYLDTMMLNRLNRLQLHLTDDQGWRVESHAFPRLHELGSVRAQTQVGSEVRRMRHGGDLVFDGTPHGGYYTRADLAEIVAYASARGIEIVPEIDLPGHSTPLLLTIPELRLPELRDATPAPVSGRWGIHTAIVSPLPEARGILQTLIGEIADAVPSRYLHVGGDECVLDAWRSSPSVNAYLQASGLPGLAALRVEMNQFLVQAAEGLGRRAIVWDEAFVDGGLPRNAIVMVWRDASLIPYVADAGYDLIASPKFPTYLDYGEALDEAEPLSIQAPLPTEEVVAWDPLAGVSAIGRPHVLGIQGQMWGEYLPHYRAVEYAAYPRLGRLAATAWRGAPVRDDDAWAAQEARLIALGVNLRPAGGPLPWQRGGTGARASAMVERLEQDALDWEDLLRSEADAEVTDS